MKCYTMEPHPHPFPLPLKGRGKLQSHCMAEEEIEGKVTEPLHG